MTRMMTNIAAVPYIVAALPYIGALLSSRFLPSSSFSNLVFYIHDTHVEIYSGKLRKGTFLSQVLIIYCSLSVS